MPQPADQAQLTSDREADRTPPWHVWSAERVLSHLSTRRSGLSAAESAARLARHGANELVETKSIRPGHIFLRQFHSLLIWMLLGAGLVSGLFREWLDCAAILAIVLVNALFGFSQELSAEKSIAALRRLTAPQARVRREDQVQLIPSAQVVPGDVLVLEAGDLVAADARLLEATALSCNEAPLTGESVPTLKDAAALADEALPLGDRANLVFLGTSVSAGLGTAVVVATGMNTEMGRIAGLIETAAEEATPLQKRLESLGRTLVWVSLGIVAAVFALGWWRGLPAFELFMTSVSLAVAAVPEGLPAVVTVALGLGVMRLARRQALMRRLPAVETLGSTTVICTDKTGTLTMGEMTVREMHVAGHRFEVTGEGYGPHGEILLEGRASEARHAGPLLELANVLIGCNNAHLLVHDGRWEVIGDPTEGALLAAGHKAGGRRERLEQEWPRHHEIPFDSDRKRRTVLRLRPDGTLRAFINGAPDLLLERCTRVYSAHGPEPLTAERRARLIQEHHSMTRRGLRVLGSACRDLSADAAATLTAEEIEQDLTFVGQTGMFDPPRPEAAEAIRRCRQAGIRVVMITGDHPQTALSIAAGLGLTTEATAVLTGAELEAMTDEELRRRVTSLAVFARASAAHKLRIVRAWKAVGAVVAMTGDGVNDAPALKGADIGIAMGRAGTEVTKQAADMILTDDNFASIVNAVEEGRGIYSNIRKSLQYLLATNAGELLFIALTLFLGLPMPLLPIHLLWINLVTDGLPALGLATGPLEPGLLREKPRPLAGRMTDRTFLGRVILTGVATAVLAWLVFRQGLPEGQESQARTRAFTVLVFSQILAALSFWSEKLPLWRLPARQQGRFLAIVAGSLALQFLVLNLNWTVSFLKLTPLPWGEMLQLLGLSLLPLFALELGKGWVRAWGNRTAGTPR